jgi:hypothetical protein
VTATRDYGTAASRRAGYGRPGDALVHDSRRAERDDDAIGPGEVTIRPCSTPSLDADHVIWLTSAGLVIDCPQLNWGVP